MRLFTIIGVILLVVGIGFAAVPFLPGSGGFWGEFRNEGAGIAALTLIPMGVVFTAIGLYFGRLTAGRSRLLREGIPGEATIVSLDGGSMVVNNINYLMNFRLLVTVPGRPPYQVTHKQLVPIFSIASLPIGGTVPVMVDTRDPQRLTIDLAGQAAAMRHATAATAATTTAPTGARPAQVVPNTLSTMRGASPNVFTTEADAADPGWQVATGAIGTPPSVAPVVTTAGIGGLTGATLGAMMGQLRHAGVSIDPAMMAQAAATAGQTTLDASPAGRSVEETLLATGTPGTAFIREANDTGIDVHGDSVVELTLDVTPQGGAPYEVRSASLVPANARARALPGATLSVRIDPTQPDSVAIDWLR